MNWTTERLGDLVKRTGGGIQTGPFGSQLHRSDYTDSGTPVVMPQDIVDDRVDTAQIAYVPEDITTKLSRHKLVAGDIVYPRRGDLGKRALIREHEQGWLCGTGCIRLRVGDGNLEPQYFYYFLKQPEVVKFIENKAVGATMLNLNTSILESVEVRFPATRVQQRIADILSAYDDLIENNKRRMALLEESIHLLYREWFVYRRFPGHERTAIVNGVPEGWTKCTVKEAFDSIGGSTPRRKNPDNWEPGTITWYVPSDLTKTGSMFMEQSGEKISQTGFDSCYTKMFPPFTVMMTSRATIGALAINTTPACANQGFIICLPNERVPVHFLYCWLKHETPTFLNVATGATFKELGKRVFRKLEIVLPPRRLTTHFEDLVQPIGEQILNLQRQNKSAREARDLLLPRLMDGRIPV